MTIDRGNQVWDGNWRAKIKNRLHAIGCETVADFLARFPAEPYTKVAERLGDDVAAFQLEWMQFEEEREEHHIQSLAIDSLTRDLNFHLSNGWRCGAKDDFNTAGAYADWIIRLENQQVNIGSKAQAVWAALEELRPPQGWSPSGPDDEFIVQAFAKGWSEF